MMRSRDRLMSPEQRALTAVMEACPSGVVAPQVVSVETAL